MLMTTLEHSTTVLRQFDNSNCAAATSAESAALKVRNRRLARCRTGITAKGDGSTRFGKRQPNRGIVHPNVVTKR